MWVAACFAAGISIVSSMAVSSRALAQTAEPVPAPPAAATPLPPVTVETTAQPKKAAAKKKAKQKSVSPVATGPAPAQPQPAPSTARGTPNSGTGPVEGYLAEQTTTGIKTDTPLKEVPQSVSVVGAEQMRDQGVQNIQEAVRYVPGVLADGFGFDSRSDFSVIRGSAAAYYIDGLRRTYGYWANTATIEPYSLERVEVLRGPASMIYGQTPVGGIINGISKLPQATPYNEIGFDYGSFDFKQVRFDSTGTVTTDGKWMYRITGLARDADTQVDNVENDRYMIQPSITYRPTNDTSITLLANLRKDDTGSTQQFLPAEGTLTPIPGFGRVPRDAFMGNPDDYHRVEEQTVSLLVDHKFSSALSIHHGMRYTDNSVDFDTNYPLILTRPRIDFINSLIPILNPANSPFLEGTLLPRVRSIEQNDTRVFNSDTYLTTRFDTGPVQHKLMGGVDYMHFSADRASASLIDNLLVDPAVSAGVCFVLGPSCPYFPGIMPPQNAFDIFNPSGTVPPYYVDLGGGIVLPGDIQLRTQGQTQAQTGVYLQDQLKIGPWLATLGVRQDWLHIESSTAASRSEQATTWRGALMYETDFGLNPYVSYGQSFTPQLGAFVGENLLTQFNDRTPAGPSEGEQIEVGVKYQPDGAWFAVNIAAFDLKETNLVATADPSVFADLSGAATHVRGFELELVGQVTRELRVVGGYTYMDGIWDKYPDPLGAKAGTQLEGTPKNMASLWGVYTLQDGPLGGLSFGAGVRYVGSITDTAPILTVDPFAGTFGQIGIGSIKVPAYTLFDAMVAYETDDWRWQLTAQNLEDEYYITQCYVFRGDCGIGQGRTVISGFTYKF
jgi:iron complex outermembrane receptor protein